uniref:Uncharacterized protein n=1 Tax=Anguilla anguilla TaxID=7936 RepID=A0A0E9UKU9_ANGAN
MNSPIRSTNELV